jgi:hypothetical protein
MKRVQLRFWHFGSAPKKQREFKTSPVKLRLDGATFLTLSAARQKRSQSFN